MEHVYSDGEEDVQYDNAKPSLNSNAELDQNDDSAFAISELKMEFEKMRSELPLMMDVKQETDSKKCQVKSCLCGNELDYPNYISFISTHKDFPDHCVGLGNRASHSLRFFRRTLSMFSTPVNLRSSGFSFESQINQRSTRRIKTAGDFILKCSPAATSGDIITSPSGRWIFESVQANVKATALLDCSLLFQLGVLDGKKSHSRSVSADTRLIKSSELCRLPSVLSKTNVSSELNISKRKLISCSGTNSTRSYLSPSSANSFSKGLLCCVWKSGIPYFVFSVDNDVGDVYVTSPQKVKSSVDKALDYVYMFRSRNSRNRHNNSPGVVGKMKVSSSLVFDSNKSKLTETEFVLFGCREDYLKEMESSSTSCTKSKGLSKKVAEIFRPSHSFKDKSIRKFGEPTFQLDDFMQKMFAVELRDLNELDNVNRFVQDFHPNSELAAIVVKDYHCNRNKETATSGWGLKFLEKVQVSDAGNSENSSFSCKNYKRDSKGNCGDSTGKMNVLLPAGFHGGAINGTDGPSSLTGRWKSGGHCDCGGWDLGCPLTVLENTSVCSTTLIHDEPEEDRQPVCLFVEGVLQGEPTLRMVNKSKDTCIINFQSSLSALQSFAIAVAVIHSRTPALYPKL